MFVQNLYISVPNIAITTGHRVREGHDVTEGHDDRDKACLVSAFKSDICFVLRLLPRFAHHTSGFRIPSECLLL